MFLTKSNTVAMRKNDEGRGMTRLSNWKHRLLESVAERFTMAYEQLVKWGLEHWDELPLTFPLVKEDGKPVVDQEGRRKLGKTSAHYLANWLEPRVTLRDLRLNSRLANGARNQAAETLLSQRDLREMQERDPRRLTGEVGAVEILPRGHERVLKFELTLENILNPETDEESFEELDEMLKKLTKPERLMPILFAGPDDFPLFWHTHQRRLHVYLPLLARGDDRAEHRKNVSRKQAGKDSKLAPMRRIEKPEEHKRIKNIHRLPQWVSFPLRQQQKFEEILRDPANRPRTAELALRDGAWRFNIVVDVAEPKPFVPRASLGIHIGVDSYQLFWALVGQDGKLCDRGKIDQRNMLAIIERARKSRFRRYAGKLKLERERTVKWLVALAVKHQAAIGVEDVSGVQKSTWSGKINVLRSHRDFGATVQTLTYMGILAGIPTIGRGTARQLFLSRAPYYACGGCLATNRRGAKVVNIRWDTEPVEMECTNCGYIAPADQSAAEVIARQCRKFFLTREKRAK